LGEEPPYDTIKILLLIKIKLYFIIFRLRIFRLIVEPSSQVGLLRAVVGWVRLSLFGKFSTGVLLSGNRLVDLYSLSWPREFKLSEGKFLVSEFARLVLRM